MAHTITGSDTYSPSASVPSDGDPAVAASVDSVFQILLNNDVANRTDVSHQAMDDRGKTSTVTGNIVLNDGGGSVDFELPVTFGADVDINGTVIVHTGGEFTSFAPVDIRNDSTIGSTGTDQCSVNAHADFYAETVFHNDVVVTTGDNFTAKGPVLFEGPTTTIQSPLNQIGLDDDSSTTVTGTLTVSGNAVVGEQLIVLGNATLGNSATDEHTVTGDVTMNDGLHVVESLTVDDGATISNGLDVHGSAELFSHLTVNGNTTLGNSSSDTITTNANLATPLGFVDAGRVPFRTRVGSAVDDTYDSTEANLILAISLSGSTTYTVSATPDLSGDFILFLKTTASQQLTINVPGSSSCIIAAADRKAILAFRVIANQWATVTWPLELFS